MKQRSARIPLQDNRIRFVKYLESDPCELGTLKADFLQFEMLRQICDEPTLIRCGPVYAQKIEMKHSGMSWLISLEAIVPTDEA